MVDGVAESAPGAVIRSQGEVQAGSAFLLPHDATVLCRTMAATSELPTLDAIVASFRSSFGVRRYVAQRTTSSGLRKRGSMCGNAGTTGSVERDPPAARVTAPDR
jgi:hypothetical protein